MSHQGFSLGHAPQHWRLKATASATQNQPAFGCGAIVDSATPLYQRNPHD